MASTRAAEYRLLIEEILAEDAVLCSQGLCGLSEFEIMELKDMLARIQRKMIANMPREK
jgi:hypothetical protein